MGAHRARKMAFIRDIETTIIFREYTEEVEDTYDIRAHKNDKYYTTNPHIDFYRKELNKWFLGKYIDTNGDINGFWRRDVKKSIKKITFFRPNNCSCGHHKNSWCPHEKLYNFVKFYLNCNKVFERGVYLNVMKFF